MPIDWSKIATPALLSIVVLFLLYRRIRRSIGRQPLRRSVMQFRLLLLVVVAGMLILSPTMTPAGREAAAVGALAGAALAAFSLRHTKFESTGGGQFYTPHLYIGLAVIVLLLARIGYRLLQVYGSAGTASPADPNVVPVAVSTPLTFGFLFATLGYYACYIGGVLWKSGRMTPSTDGSPPGQTT